MRKLRRLISRELESGDEFGGYHLESLLGEGAMGLVFRAVRDGVGGVVALKVLKRELAEDVLFKQRFGQEARAAAEVQHPSLVPIFEAGEANGRPYLAVLYAEGGTLEERLEANGPFGVDETLRLAGQLAAGLDALHGEGLVHRDMKASNIVFDADGNGMLTDFGLARGPAYTVLTRPGQVVGTLEYLAPELFKGERATSASDIYALGCTVYECLTGSTPFADKKLFEIGLAHLEGEPADPAATRPEIGAQLSMAVLTALEKDPARRPRSAGDYAAMLASAHANRD